jgi:hypothetical protein
MFIEMFETLPASSLQFLLKNLFLQVRILSLRRGNLARMIYESSEKEDDFPLDFPFKAP